MTEPDLSRLSEEYRSEVPEDTNKSFSFNWYLQELYEDPLIARSSHQRLADMFEYYGTEYNEDEGYVEYELATKDPINDGKNKFFGRNIHRSIHKFVNKVTSGARRLGEEKKIKLLLGPVGSGKSDFDSQMRQYFEDYTNREDGRMYTFKWVNLQEVIDDQDPKDDTVISPMNQDPLVLLPQEQRGEVLRELNSILEEDSDVPYTLENTQELDPASQFYRDELLQHYDNSIEKVLDNHIEIIRLTASENRRRCIETFEPKDKKNQDESELTGDVDYSKIAVYGENDPRSFDYEGALCNANRGIFSGEELLKLQKEFLYDFLHATQEQTIKPKNNPRIDIDQVIVGRTNMPEYLEKRSDETMEAFNDRTKVIRYPYVLEYEQEARIYNKMLENADIPDVHIEPHTLEMAGLFAILSRIMEPNKSDVNIIQKAHAYNGEENMFDNLDVSELKQAAAEAEWGEGLKGISARFISGEVSEAILDNLHKEKNYVSPLTVFTYFEENLEDHGSIPEEDIQKYERYIELVRDEYKDLAIDDVQAAIAYDMGEIQEQGEKYIDNVMAYIDDNQIEDELTGKLQDPDEQFMQAVEREIGIKEDQADDFRQEISYWISRRAREEKTFKPQDNKQLQRGLEQKVWNDMKHNINFKALVSDEEDGARSEWIDSLIEHGYSEDGARELLEFAGAELANEEIDSADD
jgi:serine protein kinase